MIRTQGSSRPVSVIQLLMNARKESTSTNINTIKRYFELIPGTQQPRLPHPAIPLNDILFFDIFCQQANPGAVIPVDRAIFVFRSAMFFPFQYNPYPWTSNINEESPTDCFKSVFAQCLYIHKINTFAASGVNFIENGYCPEECEETKEFLHEREDHGHLLKRLTNTFRQQHMTMMDMRRFVDALKDADTGPTKQAFAGDQKQSVSDCERLWSRGVLEFMERKGYITEFNVVKVFHNWHRAVDGRGFSEQERSTFVKDMLKWLLSDWMPGYTGNGTDFRKLDVSRRIQTNHVNGLTRETVVGFIANLTSLELYREEYILRGLPPEHPRSGTSDDVECFISVLHEMLRDIFDLKDFYASFPKIMNEFYKRISRDTRFYYWTGRKH